MGRFSDYFRDKIKQVDGEGSGIDSDLLDGKTSNEFATDNLSNVDNNIILNKLKEVDGSGSGLNADMLDGKQVSELADTNLSNVEDEDILNKLKNVDGSGSGLDADKVRGRDVIAYEDENRLRSHTMTEAEFRALQEQRRKQYAGSGFVEWGNDVTYNKVPGSQGLWSFTNPNNAPSNMFGLTPMSFSGGDIGEFYPKINVNGSILTIKELGNKWSSGNSGAIIILPKPTTSLFTVKDSTSLNGDMKQGDFAILKDLDRELIINGTFNENIDGWVDVNNDNTLSYDSDNNRLKVSGRGNYIKFSEDNRYYLKGIKYKVRFDYDNNEETPDIALYYGGYILNQTQLNTGSYEFEFVGNGHSKFEFLVFDLEQDHYCYFDNISIKQAEEQPIVALQDMSAGIDVYENADKFEARDSVSRQDLAFLEAFEVDITTRRGYPYGNTQYRGGNVCGLSGIAEGDFEGADTYSLFGNWQQPNDLVGKGYNWNELSIEDKIKFASDPDNNIYLSEDDKVMQTQYRIRVIKGLSNKWSGVRYGDLKNHDGALSAVYNYFPMVKGKLTDIYQDIIRGAYTFLPDNTTWSGQTIDYVGYKSRNDNYGKDTFEQNVFALPIALIQRPNDGIFHKIYNPAGTAYLINSDGNDIVPFEEFALDNTYITSLEDCFDVSKIAYKDSDGNYVAGNDDNAETRTGLIASGVTANEAGRYADEINEMDIEDLRMSAHKKPLEEIHNIEKLKDITGERRGKEVNSKFYVFANNEDVLYTGDSINSNKAKKSLYVAAGTDDYTLKEYNKIIYSTENRIIHIFDDNGNYIKLMYKSSYKLRRLTFNHTNKSYGLPWSTGSTVKLTILVELADTYTFNNTLIQTDLIGDPRSLSDRVKYITTSGDDQTAVIRKNTYVKADGNYYRSLVDRGNDAITIDPDTEDYNNTDNWINLGDDGSIGGYKDEWIEKGFSGTPLLVGEKGESLLPIDLGHSRSDNAIAIKANRKMIESNYWSLYVLSKNGSFIKYHYSSNDESKSYFREWNKNIVNINITDSYSDLGYTSAQEMLDLMKVIVIYKTKTNTMELADNSEVYTDIFSGWSGNHYGNKDNVFVYQNLINKVPTGNNNNSTFRSQKFVITNTGYRSYSNMLDSSGYYGYVKDTIKEHKYDPSVTHALKYFTYLTQKNNRLYLQYVFKELKYDGSWGDDNKFQITNKVSTTTDTNGNTVLFGQKRVPLPYFYNEN